MFKKNLTSLFLSVSFTLLFLFGASPVKASSLTEPVVKMSTQTKPKKKVKNKAVKNAKSAKKKSRAKKGKNIKTAAKKGTAKAEGKKTVKSVKKQKTAAAKGAKRAAQKKMKKNGKKGSTAPKTVREKSKRQCAATTAQGIRCKRNAAPGSKYCWQHRKMH